MTVRLSEILDEHLATSRALAEVLPRIEEVADVLASCFERGGRLYVFGNGGSAAEAQHLAAELVGRFHRERRPLPAMALSTDTSALTCIGNDYAFEDVFARQVRALVRAGEVVVGISTSGRSPNVVRGLAAAAELQAITIALTGHSAADLEPFAKYVLPMPSASTARIQELHLLVVHMLCERIDGWALSADSAGEAT